MSFRLRVEPVPLHTGLHTWYVGREVRPATIRGFTDLRGMQLTVHV